MTEIWLIRHGETDWNRVRRLQGWTDIPLNDHGRFQAASLAERLREEALAAPFHAIYSSDLQRAFDTARPVAEALDLRVRAEPGLRERCYGVLEGLTMDTMDSAQPEAAAAWRSREPQRAVEGGETLRQFRDRVVATVDDAAQRHVGERLLMFTHGGALDIVWRHAQDLPLTPPRAAALLNAGINRIAVSDGKWRIMGWGDVTHIEARAKDDVV